MKVPFKKPAPELRTGMEVIPHTVRKGDVNKGQFATATLRYPEGHPMRKYKDQKRALKQAKQAK